MWGSFFLPNQEHVAYRQYRDPTHLFFGQENKCSIERRKSGKNLGALEPHRPGFGSWPWQVPAVWPGPQLSYLKNGGDTLFLTFSIGCCFAGFLGFLSPVNLTYITCPESLCFLARSWSKPLSSPCWWPATVSYQVFWSHSCSLYRLFSEAARIVLRKQIRSPNPPPANSSLGPARCAWIGIFFPFLLIGPSLHLLLSSSNTGLLSTPQSHDFTPRVFALVAPAWYVILSNDCMTTSFSSFRFQLKCHFDTWSPFLKSFLPCHSLSFASPCLHFL